jgi:hypothetical protein
MSDEFWSNWNELTSAQQAIATSQISDARRANPDFDEAIAIAIIHNLMTHEQQSRALHNLSNLRKERKERKERKGGKRRSKRAHSKRRVHRKSHRKSHRRH